MKNNMFLFVEITEHSGVKLTNRAGVIHKIEDLNAEGWFFVDSFSARETESQLIKTVAVFEQNAAI